MDSMLEWLDLIIIKPILIGILNIIKLKFIILLYNSIYKGIYIWLKFSKLFMV